MGAFFVVDLDPVGGNFSNLVQIFKQISIQHFMPIISVEPLNEGVLTVASGATFASDQSLSLASSTRTKQNKA